MAHPPRLSSLTRPLIPLDVTPYLLPPYHEPCFDSSVPRHSNVVAGQCDNPYSLAPSAEFDVHRGRPRDNFPDLARHTIPAATFFHTPVDGSRNPVPPRARLIPASPRHTVSAATFFNPSLDRSIDRAHARGRPTLDLSCQTAAATATSLDHNHPERMDSACALGHHIADLTATAPTAPTTLPHTPGLSFDSQSRSASADFIIVNPPVDCADSNSTPDVDIDYDTMMKEWLTPEGYTQLTEDPLVCDWVIS